MGANSKIEWTDHTFNPWTGCTKVSPGCANCYAEGWSKRSGLVKWGPGQPRRRTLASNWREPVKWNATSAQARSEAYANEAGIPRRQRVFCASLADWLDDDGVPIEWLADLLAMVDACRDLDWLLLTKRPQNWRARVEAAADWHFDHGDRNVCGRLWDWLKHGIAPPNVWIGATLEDQKRAHQRIPLLVAIPAVVRFLSCEPLLERVDLTPFTVMRAGVDYRIPGIHWIIAGGESGPGARPMHPDWARTLRHQATLCGVAFLFKQWGEWLPAADIDVCDPRLGMTTSDLRYHPLPSGGGMIRVGKHEAGRLLDGREWNEFPEVRT